MSTIPDALLPWVAQADQGPTAVVAPVYIDYRAAKDLFA